MDELVKIEDLYAIQRGVGRQYGYPEPLCQQVRAEKEFVLTGEYPDSPDRDICLSVGRRKTRCPHCGFDWNSTQSQHRRIYLRVRGVGTGVEFLSPFQCKCVYYEYLARLLERIPPRFRAATIAPVKTDRISTEALTAMTDTALNNSEANFLLLGPAGIGKTTIAYSLISSALDRIAQWMFLNYDPSPVPSVWTISLAELFAEHSVYNNRDFNAPVDSQPEPPKVSKGTIVAAANAGFRPVLMLEELDKVANLTPTRRSILFGVLNALHEHDGQIIVTGNVSSQQIRKLLAEGPDDGQVYYRRLIPEHGRYPSFLVDFTGKPVIEQNGQVIWKEAAAKTDPVAKSARVTPSTQREKPNKPKAN